MDRGIIGEDRNGERNGESRKGKMKYRKRKKNGK